MESTKNHHCFKTLKSQTSKRPSDFFLWTTLGFIAASATLKCLGKNHTALSVGQLAIPLLLLGISVQK